MFWTKDMDTSGNELSDLEQVEFFWENHQEELDVVFKPGIDISFSPTTFKDMEMAGGLSSENPIVLDEKVDKENSAPITPVSERPTEPSRLLRRRSFGRRIENVQEFAYTTLFE